MLAGLFAFDGIKAEQGSVLVPAGFNTSFPSLSAAEAQGKEATRPLGSTANCAPPHQHRELGALAWELRSAGARILFAHTLISEQAQAVQQGARELVEVLLSCTKSVFAGEAARASALRPAAEARLEGALRLWWVSEQRLRKASRKSSSSTASLTWPILHKRSQPA